MEIDNRLTISTKVEGNGFTIVRKTPIEERRLVYNADLCVGCGMCAEACLSGCIELNPPSVKGKAPLIVIDVENCHLCGVCSEVCIFNAIDVVSNGRSIKEFDCTPRYSVVYDVDTSKCPEDCKSCEIACPRGALKCKTEDGKKLIVRNEKLCIYCTNCRLACPEDAILVEKPISGEIEIDEEKCQVCGACADICPTNAISFPKDRKIEVNEEVCLFCKACVKVCAVEAIRVRRKSISVISLAKGPWTKVHEEAFKRVIG